ncbi:MAG: polysaccharide deacetylase family protein [Clostridia bacterium]|nr:polysaccharide deacetylase family protein [Clostridia bacterium]
MTIRFPGGLRKAVTLSYDDGVEQDVRLMEILNAHGLKATFNLNSGCYAPPGLVWPKGQVHRRMTEEAVRALYVGSGHEVAVHTLTHPDLTDLPRSEMVREVLTDRLNLEKLTGGLVRGAAYPFGTFSDAVVDVLRDCGIVYCRTVISSHDFSIPQDWLRLRPTCHHADPELMPLTERFLADPAGWTSRLFYLWGHAYEFEGSNNWEVIINWADRISGRDDIWYCTNIEICDYMAAARSLIPTADGRAVYNPTAMTVYVQPDMFHEAVEVPSGQLTALA